MGTTNNFEMKFTLPSPIQPSSDVLSMLIPFYTTDQSVDQQFFRGPGRWLTSTSFLLLESLAFTSIGVNPANFAHRCALVVFPIPGGPVIITARKTFRPSLPGFLKPDLRLEDLLGIIYKGWGRMNRRKG